MYWAFKCQTGLAPSYLTSSCVPSSTVPGRVNLRSASTNTLLLPRTRTKTIGPRGFFYSCPAAWNSLPQCSQNLRPIAVRFQEKPENVSFSKINFSCNSYNSYLALFVYFFRYQYFDSCCGRLRDEHLLGVAFFKCLFTITITITSLVDARGIHGLCCKRSAGRTVRHNTGLNDMLCRACVRSGVPSSREPIGLFRSDGKRPDGMTLVPWKVGRCLTWDVTCPDTLAASHRALISITPGAAAERAALLKHTKYAAIKATHDFVPVAIEPWALSTRRARLFYAKSANG